MGIAFCRRSSGHHKFSSAGNEIESIAMFLILLAVSILFLSGLLALLLGRQRAAPL